MNYAQIIKLKQRINHLAEENKRLRHEITQKKIDNSTNGNIIAIVSQITNITPMEMKSRSRKRPISLARNMCMYLMYLEKMTYTDIGIAFHRDHSTAIHSIRNFEDALFWEFSAESKLMSVYSKSLITL